MVFFVECSAATWHYETAPKKKRRKRISTVVDVVVVDVGRLPFACEQIGDGVARWVLVFFFIGFFFHPHSSTPTPAVKEEEEEEEAEPAAELTERLTRGKRKKRKRIRTRPSGAGLISRW